MKRKPSSSPGGPSATRPPEKRRGLSKEEEEDGGKNVRVRADLRGALASSPHGLESPRIRNLQLPHTLSRSLSRLQITIFGRFEPSRIQFACVSDIGPTCLPLFAKERPIRFPWRLGLISHENGFRDEFQHLDPRWIILQNQFPSQDPNVISMIIQSGNNDVLSAPARSLIYLTTSSSSLDSLRPLRTHHSSRKTSFGRDEGQSTNRRNDKKLTDSEHWTPTFWFSHESFDDQTRKHWLSASEEARSYHASGGSSVPRGAVTTHSLLVFQIEGRGAHYKISPPQPNNPKANLLSVLIGEGNENGRFTFRLTLRFWILDSGFRWERAHANYVFSKAQPVIQRRQVVFWPSIPLRDDDPAVWSGSVYIATIYLDSTRGKNPAATFSSFFFLFSPCSPFHFSFRTTANTQQTFEKFVTFSEHVPHFSRQPLGAQTSISQVSQSAN